MENFTKEDFIKNYGLITKDDIKQDYKNLNYISWAKAWRLAMEQDPNCNYDIIEKIDENGIKSMVWIEPNDSCLVRTSFTFKNKTISVQLSIMDNSHKPVKKENLNSNYISNSIMRCLAKNIALFGIGLNVYEGEDIPEESEDMSIITKKNKENKMTSQDKLSNLCRELISENAGIRDNIIAILKKYEKDGNPLKMTSAKAKEAYKEIEKNKGAK